MNMDYRECIIKNVDDAALKAFPVESYSFPVVDGHIITIGEALRYAFKRGANWQFQQDADLGSPPYERGFIDGREYERNIHRKEKKNHENR